MTDTVAMASSDEFQARMVWLIDYIHDAPKAKNAESVYLPGEIEWEKREKALAAGITLPPDAVDSLLGLAQDTGINFLPR